MNTGFSTYYHYILDFIAETKGQGCTFALEHNNTLLYYCASLDRILNTKSCARDDIHVSINKICNIRENKKQIC
jgi:hypothetical protein